MLLVLNVIDGLGIPIPPGTGAWHHFSLASYDHQELVGKCPVPLSRHSDIKCLKFSMEFLYPIYRYSKHNYPL
jgi:hypothetical protein